MKKDYIGRERRQFIRLDYTVPVEFKICRKETINKLLQGYTSNISHSGILCRLKDKVEMDDILWLSFDRSTLDICQELEKNSLIYQSGIIGKVVRIEKELDNTFSVGMQFITREEKDTRAIYSDMHFLDTK